MRRRAKQNPARVISTGFCLLGLEKPLRVVVEVLDTTDATAWTYSDRLWVEPFLNQSIGVLVTVGLDAILALQILAGPFRVGYYSGHLYNSRQRVLSHHRSGELEPFLLFTKLSNQAAEFILAEFYSAELFSATATFLRFGSAVGSTQLSDPFSGQPDGLSPGLVLGDRWRTSAKPLLIALSDFLLQRRLSLDLVRFGYLGGHWFGLWFHLDGGRRR
jgi:hypothetical protein